MGILDFVTYTLMDSQHVFFDYMTPNWIYPYLIEEKKKETVSASFIMKHSSWKSHTSIRHIPAIGNDHEKRYFHIQNLKSSPQWFAYPIWIPMFHIIQLQTFITDWLTIS
jgi:hypothetical protein